MAATNPTHPPVIQSKVIANLAGKTVTVAQVTELQRRALDLSNLPEWERDRALERITNSVV